MRLVNLRYMLLFFGFFLTVNAIQVHESDSEETSSPTPITHNTTNVSATQEAPTITLAPSVTPSTFMISTTTYSNDNGSHFQTSKNAVSVTTDSSAVQDFNQKRQLYSRHGSYVIGSDEIVNKEIDQRESKELALNHGEHLKKDFKPSPELRITSPHYEPSMSTYTDSPVISGSYTPPNPYGSTVKFQDITEEKFKWHSSPSTSPNRGSFTPHTVNSDHSTKTKLKSDYPKFEAIVKNTQSRNQPNYQKQLFHRHNSEASAHGRDGSKEGGDKVVWTASEDQHHSNMKETHFENETEIPPPPTFLAPTYDSHHHHHHHHQTNEQFDGHDTPFSPPSGFGAPTFGYPGIDSETDVIIRTSDKPDIHAEHDYDVIQGNDHIKAPPLHGTGAYKYHHQHNKHHIDHHHLWKGVFKVLAAAVPLGILFSALSPNVVIVNANSTSPPPPNIPVFPNRPALPNRPPFPPPPLVPINPRPGTLFAGRLRTDGEKDELSANFISDLLKDVNVGEIDPGRAPQMTQVCENRYFCELGRMGSRSQNDKETAEFLQKLLWKIAIEIPNFRTKQPSKAVFDDMARDNCTKYYCKEFEHFQEVNNYDVKEWRV